MRRRLVVLGALAAFAAACTIVNGLTLSTTSSPGTTDGNVADAGTDVYVDLYPCDHFVPPSPTEIGAVNDFTGKAFITALSHVDLGIHSDSGTEAIGFDLDTRCTCQTVNGAPSPGTCVPPSETEPCDVDGGIDNAGTGLFRRALAQPGAKIDLEEDLNNDLMNGRHGVLLWVQYYNEQPDDTFVEVGVSISPGPESGGKPTFDPAGEQWSVSGADTLDSGTGYVPTGLLRGLHFVRGNKLVAKGTITIPLLAGLTVTLRDGYLVGTVAKSADSYYISDGVVTGRAPLEEVIRSIGGVPNPAGGTVRLCDDAGANPAIFTFLKQQVCDARDIRANPDTDNQNQPCDAISLGIHFTGVPATVGSRKEIDAVTYCANADVTCP